MEDMNEKYMRGYDEICKNKNYKALRSKNPQKKRRKRMKEEVQINP
jgi:hypothetical protein